MTDREQTRRDAELVFNEYDADLFVRFTTTSEDAWKCLDRSGIFVGALIGEVLIEGIELHRPEDEE